MNRIKKGAFIISVLSIFLLIFYGNVHAMAASTLIVISSHPNTNDRVIGIDDDITVVFNRNVKNGTRFSDITLRDMNNIRIPITCKIDGQTLSISPNSSLEYGKFYTVTIPYNAVRDEAGSPVNEDFTLIIATEGDYTVPSIVSMVPKDEAIDINTNSTISIKFSEKIRAGIEIEGINLIYGSNIKVPVSIRINGDTLTIKPLQELQYNTSYFIIIPSDSVMDLSGNTLDETEIKSFTTKTTSSVLKVNESKPSKDAKYISISNPIQIYFNESIIDDKGLQGITVKDKSGSVPTSVSIRSNTLYITPKNGLNFAYNTTYTVTIPAAAVKGFSGAALKTAYTFDFTTEAQMQSPKITDANPQNGTLDAAVNCTIKATFSENIKQGETMHDVILKDEKGNVIPTDLSINNNILNISPKQLLEYNTAYTYTIPYGAVTNYSNTPLKQDYDFKFKTSTDKFNPYILKSFPASGALNTTVDGGITIIFNEEIKKGDNYEYISLRDVNYNEIPIVKELSGKTIKITPANNLNLGYKTKYIMTIPYGAVNDMWENPFISSSIISFTTGVERFSPVIKFVKPVGNSAEVQIDAPIEITFNDKILKGDSFSDIVLKDSQNNIIKCNIVVVDDKIIIKSESNLENNTSYTLFLPVGGVKDYFDGVAKNDFTLKFNTCLEKIPPAVKSITPLNGSRNIDTKSSLIIRFSENVIKGKGFSKITLTNGNMKSVPYTAEIANGILTIKPVMPIEELSSHTLRIPFDAVTDKSKNQLKEDIIVNFTTKTDEVNKDALAVNEVKLNAGYSIFTIVFNKNVIYGSDIKRLLLKDQEGKIILTKIGVKNNILTIKPNTKLISGKRYTLIIPKTGLKDKQGKSMINQYSYSFIAK